MKRRENQRVLLTKRLLKEALLDLLEEKSLGQINVSELCRVADINRATFYKHYAVPQDVLREIEQDMVEDLRKMAPAVQTVDSARKYLADICEYLHDRREIMRILLRCKTDEELVVMFSEGNRRYWGQYGTQNDHGLDEDGVKLMVTFFSSGGYYLIRQWLLEDVQKTPQEVADLVFRFVTRM